MRRWLRSPALPVLALLLIVAAVYSPSLDDPWHFDDTSELDWPGVREGRPLLLPSHYRGAIPIYTWAWNYRISGEDPWSFHALNILVHGLNAGLLFLWVLQLTRRRLLAVAAALLFALHPLASQPVVYITQRSTSLAALFVLASLCAWRQGQTARSRRRVLWILVSVAAFAAGTWTKHVAFVTPVLIAAMHWLFPVGRRSADSGARRAVILGGVLFLLILGVRGAEYAPRVLNLVTDSVPQIDPIAGTSPTPLTTPRIPRAEYAAAQPSVVARYLGWMVWPAGLNIDHDVPPATPAQTVAWLGVLGAGLAVSLRLRRRAPLLTLGAVVVVVALLPTSSWIPSRDLLFEHRAYLPLAGFCLMAAAGVAALARRFSPRAVAAIVLVVGAVLATATTRRIAVWDTEVSLWTDAAAKSPGKARPHVNLGLAYQNQGQPATAEDRYQRALRIQPDHPIALNNLGNIRRGQGRTREAESLLVRALEGSPTYLEPIVNLGNLAVGRRDWEAADGHFAHALRLDPASVVARYNWAKSLELRGDPAAAAREYERVTARRPDNSLFHNDLGCARLQAGDLVGAEAALRRALELAAGSPVSWYNLGLVLEQAGRPAEAHAAVTRALELEPSFPAAETLLRRLGGGTESGGAR